MKRTILLLSILALPLLAMAQNVGQPGEPTFFEQFVPNERIHDFGDIREQDGVASYTFLLKNTSTKPLVISDVNAWCGCTTADYTKEPIRPGKSARVKVMYNPYGRPGKFSKEVVVFVNDGKQFVRVWVKGNVLPFRHPVTEDHPYYLGEGLYINQEVFPFPPREVGKQYTFNVHLANETDKPMTIQLVKKPDNKVLKVPAVIKLAPQERTVVKMSYRQPRIHKYNSHIVLQPIVNGKKVKPLLVRWFANKQ